MAQPISVEVKYKGTLPRMTAKATRIYEEEITRGIETVLMWLWRKVIEKIPVHTAALRGSVKTEIRGKGIGMRGVVGTPAKYALPVERGRKPGKFPNLDAIRLWVNQKLGVTDEKAVYLIGRKIQQLGIPAVEMFERTAKEENAAVQRIMDQANVRVMNRLRRT